MLGSPCRMSGGDKCEHGNLLAVFNWQSCAIDPDDLAGDEGSLRRTEEGDRVGDLLRPRAALERHGGVEHGFLVRRAGEPIEHRGIGRAGRDRVDADTKSGGFERGGLGQAFHRVLARGVEREIGGATLAHRGGDIDDAAGALRLHYPQFVLQAQKGAKHIGVEYRSVALRRLRGERSGLAFGARVVDGDIQTTKASDRLVDQAANVVFMTHVGSDEHGLGSHAVQLGFEGPALGLVTAGDEDRGAFPGEGERGGATDAGQGAGDQDDGSTHSNERPCLA